MSEEHGPSDLVRNAKRAEQAGFEFANHFESLLALAGRIKPCPHSWPAWAQWRTRRDGSA
jgi:hypothetical protein